MKILIYDEQHGTAAAGGASQFNDILFSKLNDKMNIKIFNNPKNGVYNFLVKIPYLREIIVYPFLFLVNLNEIYNFNTIILTSTFSLFFHNKKKLRTISIVHALFYIQIQNVLPVYKDKYLIYLILKILYPLCKLIEIKSLSNSSAIVCPRYDLKKYIQSSLKGYNGQIYVIPQFADKTVFYKLNSEKKYDILFIGRGTNAKGFHDLINLIDSNVNLKFLVIGKKIEGKIFNNRKNVTFFPEISNDKLVDYYNESRILFMPSYSETGPLVTLESLMCGVPVIGSIQGCGDFVENGQSGFIYSSFSINQFNSFYYEIIDKYSSFSRNSLKRSEYFDSEIFIKKLYEII